MKKILILITTLLIVSCSKDDSDFSNSISNTNLVSITKNYYNNNILYTFEKLNFYEQKLINIQYKDGSYDDYQYSNNLVSSILEFDLNDILMWTTTYKYDNDGRIIEISIKPSSTNSTQVTREKIISYNTDQIICVCTWSGGGYNKYEFTLNTNGEITSEKLFDINGNQISQTISYNFSNKNLLSFTIINSITNTQEVSNFTYSNLKNDYNYKKYLFGTKWKTNSFLWHKQQFGVFPSGNYESETSENLVSSFSDNSRNYSFNYIFNEKNQIIKETQNFTTTGINAIFESKYEYK